MALGRKTGGRDFVSGHKTPGPGRPRRAPLDIAAIREMDDAEFTRIANRLLFLPLKAVKSEVGRPGAPIAEILVGAFLLKAYETMDTRLLNLLFDRILGKAQ